MSIEIRPLAPSDLDAVVALDQRAGGTRRRAYFERRLAAARAQPKRHLQVAAASAHGLVGFLLARRADGEYGRASVLLLESLGVDEALRRGGVGQRMLAAVERLAGERAVSEVVTQVGWRNHAMLRFLSSGGFSLAPWDVLERPVLRLPLPGTDEEIEAQPPVVRHLRREDLADLLRVDEARSGERREAYLARKLDEALEESAIRVSLAVEDDARLVGFATARVHYGDFGHVAPRASLDTIAVQPGFEGKGLGRALLGQMVDNLAALHVEALETEVSDEAEGLRRFLRGFGFRRSERLVFAKRVRAA